MFELGEEAVLGRFGGLHVGVVAHGLEGFLLVVGEGLGDVDHHIDELVAAVGGYIVDFHLGIFDDGRLAGLFGLIFLVVFLGIHMRLLFYILNRLIHYIGRMQKHCQNPP